MSIQWTIIATFLYAEIAAVLLLLVPLISPHRWQKLFKSRFLKSLEHQSNLYFSVFIFILILFFLDAIREMRKYTGEMEDVKTDSHGHLSAELQLHMKLFRAQRNFYIAGFALFLWLVLRRLVTLISAQATLQASNEAVLKQAQSATEAAEQLLKQETKKKNGTGESADNEGNAVKEEYEKEINQLKQKLLKSEDELKKTKLDFEIMKKQSESLTKEYDRILDETHRLQTKLDQNEGIQHSKKDE